MIFLKRYLVISLVHIGSMNILNTVFMNTLALNYSSSEIIYNEDHVNVRYQAFKVIRSSKIMVQYYTFDVKFG